MNLNLKNITAMLTLVGTIAGGVYFLEVRYAQSKELTKLERKVSLNELIGLKRDALKQKYFLKDQIAKYPEDTEIKKQLEEVIEELDDLKKQITTQKE